MILAGCEAAIATVVVVVNEVIVILGCACACAALSPLSVSESDQMLDECRVCGACRYRQIAFCTELEQL